MDHATRRRSRRSITATVVLAGTLLVSAAGAGAAAGTTTRTNVTPTGAQSTGPASRPALSSDGTDVLFASPAGDLGATGGLYVKWDTYHQSVAVPKGTPPDALTGQHDIDGDGTRVVFDVARDDVDIYDPVTCDEGGQQVNCPDVYVSDLLDGKDSKISVAFTGEDGDGRAAHGRISDDGRKIVFASDSTNLHRTDGGGAWDIFVRVIQPARDEEDEEDIDHATTWRLTTTEPGSVTGEPVISADGGTVAFWSTSTALVPGSPAGVNLFTVTTTFVPVVSWVAHLDDSVSLDSYSPSLSADGSRVGFISRDALQAQDTNTIPDLYVKDRTTSQVTLVGWNSIGGRAADPAGLELADGGQHALFVGGAGLVVGPEEGQRYVYVQDLTNGAIRVASVADDGSLLDADAHAGPRSLSPDGSTVVFSTSADAVADDTNDAEDVFVRVLADDPAFPPMAGGDPVEPGDLDATLDGDGATVSTGEEATADVPVVASLTPPSGVSGDLTVDMQDNDGTDPAGFSFFGTQLVIEGPASTPEEPYVVTFTVDSSELGDVDPADVQVFRDGVAVADCTDAADAVPDPCVADRDETVDGDAVITVRTSHFSEWAFGALDYAVSGPFAPVDAFPTVNTVKAGSAVPVKFALGGDRGLDVFADGYPDTEVVACGGSSDAVEQTVDAPGGSLTYDASTGVYTYVWKSTKGARGCRDLVLRFRDGSELTARFQLR